MLDELEILINSIIEQYKHLYLDWKQSNLYIPIHQKKNRVKDVNNNNEILNTILNYRLFLNENHLDIKLAFDQLNLQSEVNSRVKTQNSIEFKTNNYMTAKHEYGEVAINKCFNDLYGIRIIFKDNVEYNIIKEFIDERYGKHLKCYDASKGDYVAIHVYFKEDNYSFQWELQIWDEAHYESNIVSHENYKQDYTKWEEEIKEGNHFDHTLYNYE